MKSIKLFVLASAFVALPTFANASTEENKLALKQITAQSAIQTASDITLAIKQEIAFNVKQEVPKLSKKRGTVLVARDQVISELARPLIGE
jgi:hypothetical protein